MKFNFEPAAKNTNLLDAELLARRLRNYKYLMELSSDNLLQPYRHEAGLFRSNYRLNDCHWGWDGPLSDLRGQFTGHWLSAAARIIQVTKDIPLKQKADFIVDEIAKCQKENGGEWGFPIPEKHLNWLIQGKHTWAPQYVCHKCMMGLLDMYRYANNDQALEIALKEAEWFYRFTGEISRETMNDMMDWEETGGLMEYWADLYDITKDEKHLILMRKYERPKLFEPILLGEDILTNMHANTTIPEIHGAARAYEVTGEEKYRKIVENYWDLAVTKRGMYATGGQTSGELWTPMNKLKIRLGDKNQEHCVVYNMMRLAEYLLRWTGDSQYADYWERNLINGVLSQTYWEDDSNLDIHCDNHSHDTGLVTYYQGLAAGSHKFWGSKTEHFWCCHGTMVQANAFLHEGNFYTDDEGIVICQFFSSSCSFEWNKTACQIRVTQQNRTDHNVRYSTIQRDVQIRPRDILIEVNVKCDAPVNITIKIRKPFWLSDGWALVDKDTSLDYKEISSGFICISGEFFDTTFTVSLTKKLTAYPLPDDPKTVAFLDGPVVLAAMCEYETTLYGDIENPLSLLEPINERQWQQWLPYWKTKKQKINFNFKPLWLIGREKYTVYFPVESR